jgi:hypothetical protein
MGKPTGFLELPRLSEKSEEKALRIKHFREFVLPLVEQVRYWFAEGYRVLLVGRTAT